MPRHLLGKREGWITWPGRFTTRGTFLTCWRPPDRDTTRRSTKTRFGRAETARLCASQLDEATKRHLHHALERNGYDEGFDRNQRSLGSTGEGRSYRRWCLLERLFLNPLNEAFTDTVAATDVLHLPNHSYKFPESPRFSTYFNLLKQEYVSARYRLYLAIHGIAP